MERMDETAETSSAGRVVEVDYVQASTALLEAIERTEKRIAALYAEQVRLLAEFAALSDRKSPGAAEFAADDLALQVSWTVNMACRRMRQAVALTSRLPRV